jgi:hypothetical protein
MRRLAELGTGAVALALAWFATLPSPSVPELVAGSAAALGCAATAVRARHVVGVAWRPNPRWAAWLGTLVVAVPADTARLLVGLLPNLPRAGSGQLRLIPPHADEDPSRAAFRRAWGSLVVSASPGSIVLDWPSDGRAVTVHARGSGRPALDEVVIR